MKKLLGFGRWGVKQLLIKVVVPWLLATNSNIYQPHDSTITPRATRLAKDFEQVYRRLEDSSDTFLIPPNSPTLKFSSLSSSSSSHHHRDKDDQGSSNNNSNNNNKKPLVLYLPGLDGYGISAITQFDDLSRAFDFWHLTMDRRDRSSFRDLMKAVAWFLEQQQQQQPQDNNSLLEKPRRKIYIIGESFGGLLAPAVVLQTKQRQRYRKSVAIDGMVLINPATSFSQSNWDVLASLLGVLDDSTNSDGATAALRSSESLLPSLYSLVGGSVLAATVPSTNQLQRFFQDTLLKIPRSSISDWTDIGKGMKLSWDQLEDRLPGATVQHRIREWAMVGDAIVTPKRLQSIQTPTLVVVGKDDKMLPSQAHAKQLKELLTASFCETIVIKDGGHFVLEDRVNLTHAMVHSKVLDPLSIWANQPPYDPIVDWKLPPPFEVASIIQSGVDPLRKWFSPVFFSTDATTGRRWKGLSKLPPVSSLNRNNNDGDDDSSNTVPASPSSSSSPILIVANHQFAGFDLGMVISQLLEERNLTVRGLAHPVLFQASNVSNDEWQSNDPAIVRDTDNNNNSNNSTPFVVFSPNIMRKFGAVQVNPRNYYRLLKSGQNVLLFPGGVREVFHGRDESYQIFWPSKPDFCRTAAKFNATILPLCGIGMADTFRILLDSSDLMNLPFVGDRIRQQSSRTVAARFDTNQDEEVFQPPLALPSLPARNYFLFGRPISTHNISHNDREACAELYRQVKQEMRQGLADLIEAREEDPYQNTPKRLLYEQVNGKQAPTFSIDVLNRKR